MKEEYNSFQTHSIQILNQGRKHLEKDRVVMIMTKTSPFYFFFMKHTSCTSQLQHLVHILVSVT